MCGILFMYGPQSLERVKKSLPQLNHRGPDDQRIISTDMMALGFNRLAINGINEVGAQPMEHGDLVGVFNGEIYNYQTLSKKYGLPTSNSDTEIILPLFETLNNNFINSLDGFYSGVIFDRNTSKIWAVRDHIGKKPLFVGRTGSNVFITSELKAIEQVDYFATLPLGLSSVDATNGEFKLIHQHQSFKTNESITQIFKKAVIKRLPAPEQPIGVFLSGGLDSSLVAAVVAKHRPDANYFTLGSGDDKKSVQEVIKALNLKNVNFIDLPKSEEIPALIQELVKITESFNPSIISNGLGTYLLSKAVREAGIKVVLGGEGADELFGGYHKFTDADSNWREIRNKLINDMSTTELRRLDLASMAHSIEVRCPFLDQQLRYYSDNLDFDDLYRGELNKVILRDSFGEFLPQNILWREKTSLDVGSGIRGMVVNYLTRNGNSERQNLNHIWNEHYSMDDSHWYFSSYPIFDELINKRGAGHK